MSTQIVFVVTSTGRVVNVCEDENLARFTAARYPGARVDAWVLDGRDVTEASLDEWLEGRQIIERQFEVGETVYFDDQMIRGIGKVAQRNSELIVIECKSGEVYDKISKKRIESDFKIHMYNEDIKGVLE